MLKNKNSHADHGVRKYDPELGRFTMPDPLWEKYYGWTPWQYSANNPISLYDNDGKKIYVTGSNDSEIKAVKNYLNEMRKTETGSMMYNFLDAIPEPVTYTAKKLPAKNGKDPVGQASSKVTPSMNEKFEQIYQFEQGYIELDITDPNFDKIGTTSHETGHVYDAAKNPEKYYKEKQKSKNKESSELEKSANDAEKKVQKESKELKSKKDDK